MYNAWQGLDGGTGGAATRLDPLEEMDAEKKKKMFDHTPQGLSPSRMI
jgi:hypothetical protein